MVIISDTSPISNLIQIDKLEILQKLFGQIVIPPHVDKEVLELINFGFDIAVYEHADWIQIINPIDITLVEELEKELDKGEAQAIVIGQELKADLLIIDERIGTNKAKKLGLKTIGLLGCLIEAKNQNIIKKVKPLVEKLESQAGFYIGNRLKNVIYELVNENT